MDTQPWLMGPPGDPPTHLNSSAANSLQSRDFFGLSAASSAATSFSSAATSFNQNKRPSIIDVHDSIHLFPSHKKPPAMKSHCVQPQKKQRQTKMWQCASDPAASLEMDVAVADFVLSGMYDFALVKNEKFKRIFEIARKLPPNYKLPSHKRVGGELLTTIYDVNWANETKRLLKDARIFGISVFGDGATIKTFPKINAVASSVNNPFAMLEVFDCTDHMANRGIKDGVYIAGLFLPLIKKLESMVDDFVSVVFMNIIIDELLLTIHPVPYKFELPQGNSYAGVVDLVYFDGASNVQKAGNILEKRFPRITSACAAEHATSLFFDDIFTKVEDFRLLSQLCKKIRNVFGSVRHSPAAMFKSYSKKHNHGVSVGFIKPSECRYVIGNEMFSFAITED